MVSTQTLTTLVLLAQQDAVSALLLLTVLPVLLWPHPMETVHAHAPAKLTSQFLTELVTALLADNSARLVLMLLPAPLVFPLTLRLLITNASVETNPSSIPTATVFLVLLAAKNVSQPQSATAASVLSFSKVALAKSLATMVSLLSELPA